MNVPRYMTTCLADVAAERVGWLWAGRLPAGKLVVLDGDPGVAKSTLMLDLAARLTSGTPMPGGDYAIAPSAVVLLAAEDGLADTIRPRLDAAGADPALVFHFDAVPRLDEEGNVRRWVPPSIPDDLAALEALIVDTGAVLVIVDVLMAYLNGSHDSHRDQDVRGALAELASIADRTGACVVLLRHLRKSRGATALYAGGGSIGIIGVARAGLIAAVDPDDESGERRVLAVSKCNLSRPAPALGYRLATTADGEVARIEWLGETTHSADALMAVPDGGERSALQMAKEFLLDRLDNVGHLSTEVISEARETHDIAEKTLRRAHKEIGAVAFQQDRKWWWKLPPDAQMAKFVPGHLRPSEGAS